ncbi:MAG: DUF58 domain-containing protein [Planctomycetota bacterium]|jgi:uncharacterized protein (DUF58 family)
MTKLEHRYLSPGDLARLRGRVFTPRRAVEGLYAGAHDSPQRGQSLEFADYRAYLPGDDLSAIDWKVYARTDRLYVKLFEHQSDMTVDMLIDASASMDYGEPGERKFDLACRMAAAIGFLVTEQQDRVSLAVARNGLRHAMAGDRTTAHLHAMLHTMENVRTAGRSRLSEALDQLTARTRRRGVLIVFSDLLEDEAGVLSSLSRYVERGSEVIVFQVLHADELTLPDVSGAVFTDSESGAELSAAVDDLRAAYLKRVREFMDGWSDALRGRGIDYNLASTDRDYADVLGRYLLTRSAPG